MSQFNLEKVSGLLIFKELLCPFVTEFYSVFRSVSGWRVSALCPLGQRGDELKYFNPVFLNFAEVCLWKITF